MSFQEHIKKVKEFHESFNIPNNNTPTLLSEHEYQLRYDLIKEENEEYLTACKNQNLVEIADALGDILYIALGTLLRHGLQHKIDEVFEEIHRSNMSKLGPDGKPIYREDGKVLKGANYFKPDIKKILHSDE
ncbi:MAG: nucleoside triphosphate pyrophosphohydrolase family protein [Bacteroidia bacterium]|nr:nucleoside triphosphate pyrophosphohydrolase family protein [Bacteroidia bacterium]